MIPNTLRLVLLLGLVLGQIPKRNPSERTATIEYEPLPPRGKARIAAPLWKSPPTTVSARNRPILVTDTRRKEKVFQTVDTESQPCETSQVGNRNRQTPRQRQVSAAHITPPLPTPQPTRYQQNSPVQPSKAEVNGKIGLTYRQQSGYTIEPLNNTVQGSKVLSVNQFHLRKTLGKNRNLAECYGKPAHTNKDGPSRTA